MNNQRRKQITSIIAAIQLLQESMDTGPIDSIKNSIMTINDKRKRTCCEIVSISGSRDDQTSADAKMNNIHQGAMTNSFLRCLKKGITYKQLIIDMRLCLLAAGFQQVPQLTSGRVFDVDTPVHF